MIKKENEKNNEDFSLLEKGKFMDNLRKNIVLFKREKKWTVRTLAEKADMSEDTLGTILNGKGKDCNMSSVIKIAKALNVSIDELVEADTISPFTRESLSICRRLPENDLCLIRWYIKYFESLNKNNVPNKRYVSVMDLECNHHGNLKMTSNFSHVDISHIHEEYRYKVFFGIKIPCEHYMPIYTPFDTLLIANDRLPSANEHCIIRVSNHMFIRKRRVENGVAKYYSIRNNNFKIEENDDVEIVGYVVGFLNPDGSWGVR